MAACTQRMRLSVRPSVYLMFAALLGTAACTAGRDLPPLPADSASSGYQLGSGDQIRIITLGEDQLTGDFRVSSAGTVALPMIGTVKAAGLDPSELAEEITSDLTSRRLLKMPSVSVEVTAYRPIFVLGEVNKPGQYPYQPGMTFLTAVSVAGGFTYRAVEGYGSIVRIVDGRSVEGKVQRVSAVKPGDVVTVFERRF